MTLKHSLLVAGCLLAALGLSACGNSKSATNQQKVLNWSETMPLSTQDPSLATDTTSFQGLLNTGDGLYRLDRHNHPKLALAKQVKVSNGSKTYDFTLRSNAK